MSKKALLVGINYFGSPDQLNGCINDVRTINEMLINKYKYTQPNIKIITDEPNTPVKPTGKTIVEGIRWLVAGAKPGDTLFFMYSGHGGQIKDNNGDETDGKDEVLFCLDVILTDDMLYQQLVAPLPKGVRLTCIFDCCHSGTILDLKYNYTYTAPNRYSYTLQSKIDSNPDVVMFSGCFDSQTSADGSFGGKWITENNKQVYKWDSAQGAFTYFMKMALESCNYSCTWEQLLKNICDLLKSRNLEQISQLSVSQPHLCQMQVMF